MFPCRFPRRRLLRAAAAFPGTALLLRGSAAHAAADTFAFPRRTYHVCLDGRSFTGNPGLLRTVRDAGVTDVWQVAYLYGFWLQDVETLGRARGQVEAAGLRWHLLTIPLGHPGNSLGDPQGSTPLTPPAHWRMAERPDGSRYSGTSLHPPATAENVAALEALAALAPDAVFLDDDFRLATGPGVIGGCYCPDHRRRFLELHGHGAAEWEALLGDVAARRLTPLLRAWVDMHCDELTTCFHRQQQALPDGALGTMFMYLGAEKAGIRLAAYRDAPLRVGELMFNDRSFGPVKGKTDELFSALFHRRFATRDRCFSETTAYPHDRLSAANLAAKLVIGTLADVPNTMFMSGLTPIPEGHWGAIAAAMRSQAATHDRIGGSQRRGPLKHFWGEAARYCGDDRPFSLFLAMGLPFEVVETLPDEGHVFLCDADARHLPASLPGCTLHARPGVSADPRLHAQEERLEPLWALKRELLAAAPGFPHVVEESPAVCAWYPDARSVLVWNLLEGPARLTLRHGREERVLDVPGLGAVLEAL